MQKSNRKKDPIIGYKSALKTILWATLLFFHPPLMRRMPVGLDKERNAMNIVSLLPEIGSRKKLELS